MNKLEKWMIKNKPSEKFSSLLFEHKDEIQKLNDECYSQNQILEFLQDAYQIKTSQQNLSAFISRHAENKNQKGEKNIVKNEKNIQKNKFDEINKKFGSLV